MTGTTASLVTGMNQAPFWTSAGLISRETMPMSTMSASASAMPLPAPPAEMSKRTSGLSLRNSSDHFITMG